MKKIYYKKNKASGLSIFEAEKELKKIAKNISSMHIDTKPIKYLLKN